MRFYKILPFCLILILIFFPSCKKNGPELTVISPESRAANMPAFTLTVTGNGFENGSVIKIDGDSKITLFSDSETLSCKLSQTDLFINSPQKDLLRSGNMGAPASVDVTVENPDGSVSNKMTLSLTDNPEFSTPVKISPSGNNWFNPAIACYENREVYIVFERYDNSIPKYYISFIGSSDRGKTWSSPVDIFSSDERCYNPGIDVGPDGRIDVILYNIRLYYSQSNDGGETWNPSLRISSDTNSPLESDIFSDSSGNINIIWAQYTASNGHIFFRRSSSGGTLFSPAVNVAVDWKSYGTIYRPAITGDNTGRIVAAWEAWPNYASKYANVHTNYSLDGGFSWSSEDTSFGVTASPDIDFSPNGNIFLVLSNSFLPFQDNIKFYKAKENGASWSYLSTVSGNLEGYSPIMKIDPVGNINIIYRRNSIFHYTRSIDEGNNWSAESSVTSLTSIVDMAVDTEGNIYIVYELQQSAGSIYFTRSN